MKHVSGEVVIESFDDINSCSSSPSAGFNSVSSSPAEQPSPPSPFTDAHITQLTKVVEHISGRNRRRAERRAARIMARESLKEEMKLKEEAKLKQEILIKQEQQYQELHQRLQSNSKTPGIGYTKNPFISQNNQTDKLKISQSLKINEEPTCSETHNKIQRICQSSFSGQSESQLPSPNQLKVSESAYNEYSPSVDSHSTVIEDGNDQINDQDSTHVQSDEQIDANEISSYCNNPSVQAQNTQAFDIQKLGDQSQLTSSSHDDTFSSEVSQDNQSSSNDSSVSLNSMSNFRFDVADTSDFNNEDMQVLEEKSISDQEDESSEHTENETMNEQEMEEEMQDSNGLQQLQQQQMLQQLHQQDVTVNFTQPYEINRTAQQSNDDTLNVTRIGVQVVNNEQLPVQQSQQCYVSSQDSNLQQQFNQKPQQVQLLQLNDQQVRLKQVVVSLGSNSTSQSPIKEPKTPLASSPESNALSPTSSLKRKEGPPVTISMTKKKCVSNNNNLTNSNVTDLMNKTSFVSDNENKCVTIVTSNDSVMRATGSGGRIIASSFTSRARNTCVTTSPNSGQVIISSPQISPSLRQSPSSRLTPSPRSINSPTTRGSPVTRLSPIVQVMSPPTSSIPPSSSPVTGRAVVLPAQPQQMEISSSNLCSLPQSTSCSLTPTIVQTTPVKSRSGKSIQVIIKCFIIFGLRVFTR